MLNSKSVGKYFIIKDLSFTDFMKEEMVKLNYMIHMKKLVQHVVFMNLKMF